MSKTEEVRKRIDTVELTLKEAGDRNALHAIVDVLKEIANALDTLEKRATDPSR